MNRHNTPGKHATSLIPNRATQFFKCVTLDTCIDCGALRQEVHKQNTFSVPKHCAHNFPSWSGLLEFHLCWQWGVPPWSAASIHGLRATPMSRLLWLHGTRRSMYCVRKSNALACRFNLCSCIGIFGTQCAHNFRNLSLSDTISWRSDREIWEKCRESDVMVIHMFSLIFSSTTRTKSSFNTNLLYTRWSVPQTVGRSADHHAHLCVLH